MALANLAGVLKYLGNYEEAKSKYYIALKIQKKHFRENQVEYANSLENLAEILKDMGYYEAAKENY